MPSIGTWKKLQAASGLLFGAFLVMHLACHYSLNLGWETANETLEYFRKIYQQPVFEGVLLLATIVHMMSNTVIIMNRGKVEAKKKVSSELKGHRYSGYFLGFAIFGHVGATRIAPLLLLEDPSQYDYSFVAKVNEIVPMNIFAAYLIVLGMAGGFHLVYGIQSALATLSGSSIAGKPLPFPLKILANLNHVVIISAVLALTGYYYVVDTTTKADLHDKINEKLGI